MVGDLAVFARVVSEERLRDLTPNCRQRPTNACPALQLRRAVQVDSDRRRTGCRRRSPGVVRPAVADLPLGRQGTAEQVLDESTQMR